MRNQSVLVTSFAFLLGAATVNASPLRGSYSVPVAQELASYATFAVEGKMFDMQEKRRVFSYDLPQDLVGKKIEILLREVGAEKGLALFEGEIGNAACINGAANKLLMCFVQYHSLGFDPSAVERLLIGKYSVPEGLEIRIDVMRSFSETPGGVIRFPSVP